MGKKRGRGLIDGPCDRERGRAATPCDETRNAKIGKIRTRTRLCRSFFILFFFFFSFMATPQETVTRPARVIRYARVSVSIRRDLNANWPIGNLM